MKRRALLRAFPGLAAGAGCLDAPTAESATAGGTTPTTGVVAPDWTDDGTVRTGGASFAYDASMWDGLHPDWTEFDRADGPPTVAFEPSEGRVTVRGVLWYGSGNCDRPVVSGVEYPSNGTLHVGVDTGVRETTPETCTEDLAATSYRVTVVFESTRPEQVVATETDALGETREATASRREDG